MSQKCSPKTLHQQINLSKLLLPPQRMIKKRKDKVKIKAKLQLIIFKAPHSSRLSLKLRLRMVLLQLLKLWLKRLIVRRIRTCCTLKMSSLRLQRTMKLLSTLPRAIMKKPNQTRAKIRLSRIRLKEVQKRMQKQKLKTLYKKMQVVRIAIMRMMIISYLRLQK